ncbi:hypothetical protein [Pseudalkalibacillus hwajinpoensis]|uniref:hypothetical protein n=1 Tax=Guptibacillus hwajinpoensis TaxID=208199 RepID=UPI001CD746A8|nr:hypothetical protein [Pseudalkalibacillus hwajinpoensis]MCA0991420.1 hypothetical protein [Pseudalkalibacillus hwajinpoensis]
MEDTKEPLQYFVNKAMKRLTNSLVSKISLTIVSFLTSSTLILCIGYLFLTGYYFGGKTTSSILDITVGIIPYDRVSLLTAGIFYFMIIVVMGLFIYIVTIQKMNKATIIVVLTGVVLITYAMVLVYFTESSLEYFFRMLYFWSFPITTIVAIYESLGTVLMMQSIFRNNDYSIVIVLFIYDIESTEPSQRCF